jgi:hypothetical protein
MNIGTALFLIFVCLCGIGLMLVSLWWGQGPGSTAIVGSVIGMAGLSLSASAVFFGFWKLRTH